MNLKKKLPNMKRLSGVSKEHMQTLKIALNYQSHSSFTSWNDSPVSYAACAWEGQQDKISSKLTAEC